MSPKQDRPNSENPQTIRYRVLIKGRLTTETFLHIGLGDVLAETESFAKQAPQTEEAASDQASKGEQGTPSLVVTGDNGRAIIPASALRGAVRCRLKRLLGEPAMLDLMGKAAEEKSSDPAKQGKARRVFIQTATIAESCGGGLVFDLPSKCVDRIAMTAMSRWRRAPQDKMLRTIEAVPPGVTFEVTIGICGDWDRRNPTDGRDSKIREYNGVTLEEVSAILSVLGHDFDSVALGAKGHPEPSSVRPGSSLLQLGAFQKAGWGKVKWQTCEIMALTKSGLDLWLKKEPENGSGEQGWGLCNEAIDLKLLQKPTAADAPDIVRISLTLDCQSTFFTQDQRQHTRDAVRFAAEDARSRQDGKEIPEDRAKVMRVNGRAWLSGQSLKGALRSQFERILRTRGIPCCDPTLEEDRGASYLARKRCEPIRNADQLGRICPACQVFGAGGWASTIQISEFQEEMPHDDITREFIAISRFTGGGVPHLKFSADVSIQPKLRGTISINLERLRQKSQIVHKLKEEIPPVWAKFSENEKLGALMHLFRDFVEGDIPIGAGRSKGFGAFEVNSPSLVVESAMEVKGFGEALRGILTKTDKNRPPMQAIPEKQQDVSGEWLKAFDTLANQMQQTESAAAADSLPDWWRQSSITPPPPVAGAGNHHQNPSGTTNLAGSYNPYHWVPAVPAPNKAPFVTPIASFGTTPLQRHDIYAVNGISGEMTVRVRPVTPLFVGGQITKKAEPGSPAQVEPFLVQGEPAIPSTSLRGLLSTIYEIATASAMRVLDVNETFHFRDADRNKREMSKTLGEMFDDPNLLPLRINKGKTSFIRDYLTLAETAFGVVVLLDEREKGGKSKQTPHNLTAIASKIVMSDAMLTANSRVQEWAKSRKWYLTDEPKTLKVLNSPRPPSPAFYFDPVSNQCPLYQEIEEGVSKPRGRKMYLHLNPEKITSRPWESAPPLKGSPREKKIDEQRKMQVDVQCLRPQCQFEFTISFDNLSREQFYALCYALRPTAGFRHKLGMAKPLGLGSVLLVVQSVQKVDRLMRYTREGFNNARFVTLAREENDQHFEKADNWVAKRSDAWRTCVRNRSDKESVFRNLDVALTALETIGTVTVDELQYPMTKLQKDGEFELFQWPAQNYKLTRNRGKGGRQAQFLKPIKRPRVIDPLPW